MDLKSVLQSLRNSKTLEDNGSVSDVQYNQKHCIVSKSTDVLMVYCFSRLVPHTIKYLVSMR